MSAEGDTIQTERKTAAGHMRWIWELQSCVGSYTPSERLHEKLHEGPGQSNTSTPLRLKTLGTCLSLAGALTTQIKRSIMPSSSG